ncbi:MAG TPA: cation transporter, partial [Chloroflexota bacterium]|nr:cation transporter [Chloroflexota bacterium]
MTATRTAPTTSPATGAQPEELTLPITGMTCASCVRRVEKALGRVEGVAEANVNLATERARVAFDPARVTLDALKAAVERAGYGIGDLPEDTTAASQLAAVARGRVNARPEGEGAQRAGPWVPRHGGAELAPVDAQDAQRQREIDALKRKWQVSLTAGLAMMALMYLPLGRLRIDEMLLAPLLLIAATVVQFWAGSTFYRAAWQAARHGTTNMNTLVAVGTSVAYGYSAFVTLWPGLAARWGFQPHLYYETAVIIVALILMGR